MAFAWKGVFPALLTPFNQDESIDLKLFENNLAAQVEAGVDGLIIGGSLGEASTITLTEKEQLVKAALNYPGKAMPVILTIAEGSTHEAIRQARLAEQWGVAGLMVLPPMRYKTDHRETVAFFSSIAAASVLPVMVYNNPVDYKIEVTLDMFDELAALPSIQAVKESTRDLTNITRMHNRFGDRFQLLCGVDTIALEELVMGANGWVAGLVDAFPKETVAIYRLVKAGKIEAARSIFRWFLPLLELDIHPKLVQYIKLAAAQTGLGSEYVRAPRLQLEGSERAAILKIINDCLATRPKLPDYLSIEV